MMFSYLTKRLCRHVSEILLSASIVTVVIVLLLGLTHYQLSQQEKLDTVYDSFEIRCTVTNPTGSKETDLEISSLYIDLLTSEEGSLYPYVTDVFLLYSLNYSSLRSTQETVAASGDVISFYMTNDPEQSVYLRDVQVQYLEGYNSDSFHSDSPVCIISSALSHKIAEDGTVYLYTPWGERKSLVVGTYLSEAETVFVPWQLWDDILEQDGQSRKAHSMSFTISDNRRLVEAKTVLLDYFISASRLNKSSGSLGLIIDDSLFIDSVVVLERGIALMRVVQMLVYIMSVGVSFLVAFLTIRTRRLELAVMRSMGTRYIMLYVEVLCEHLIFFMAGALVAWPISLVLGMPPSGENLNTIGIFLICYLIGVIFAVSQVTSGQIMQILKGKE